jgi:hypothetical protein
MAYKQGKPPEVKPRSSLPNTTSWRHYSDFYDMNASSREQLSGLFPAVSRPAVAS